MKNIFVGNLSFKATREDVIKLFSPFGTVANAVIMEKKKGKSRGFGFVDMPNEEEKNAAIAALQGQEFMSRILLVSVVVPKARWPRPHGRDDRQSKAWEKPKKDFRSARQDDRSPKAPRREDRASKPWAKSGDKSKFYGSKSWGESSNSAKPPYKKFDGPSKPGTKRKSGAKPFSKPGEAFKMFHKNPGGSKTFPKKSP